jgi:hypothetical protein
VPVEAHYLNADEAYRVGAVPETELIKIMLYVHNGYISHMVRMYVVPAETLRRDPDISEFQRRVRVWYSREAKGT